MQKPNKYRRAFEFRIVRGDDPSTPKGIEAFLRLSLPQYAEVLDDYLEIGKKRRNSPFALAKLQIHLLEELATIEQAVSSLKHQAEILKAKPIGATTGEQDSSNSEFDEIDRHIYFHRAHANCIRSIGDSLVWRAVGYDRAVLRALCQNPVKQRVIGDSTQQELDEWSRANHAGNGLVFLNSITNCLSIGDITVVKVDGAIEILEVKASAAKSRRLTRQKQKMREILTLLNFGQGSLKCRRLNF